MHGLLRLEFAVRFDGGSSKGNFWDGQTILLDGKPVSSASLSVIRTCSMGVEAEDREILYDFGTSFPFLDGNAVRNGVRNGADWFTKNTKMRLVMSEWLGFGQDYVDIPVEKAVFSGCEVLFTSVFPNRVAWHGILPLSHPVLSPTECRKLIALGCVAGDTLLYMAPTAQPIPLDRQDGAWHQLQLNCWF